MTDIEQPAVTALVVQLLSAYLANNKVAHTDVPDLVRMTKAALIEPNSPAQVEEDAPVYLPAVTARKSLASPNHILSLIDGKPYKALKRHLAKHGLTPASYRDRYRLPPTYPMVAPDFAAARRAIAEKIGLGRRATETAAIASKKISSSSKENTVPVSVTDATTPAKDGAPAATANKSITKIDSTKLTDNKTSLKATHTTPHEAPATISPASVKPNKAAAVVNRPRKARGTLKLFTPKGDGAKSAALKSALKRAPASKTGREPASATPPAIDIESDTPEA